MLVHHWEQALPSVYPSLAVTDFPFVRMTVAALHPWELHGAVFNAVF